MLTTPRAFAAHCFIRLRGAARRLAWALVWSVAAAATPLALQAQEPPTKRVLIIAAGSRLAPGFMIVDQQVLQALSPIANPRLDVYAENLDTLHIPSERAQRIYVDYLSEKYSAHPPDLVILVFVNDLTTPVAALRKLFPGVPFVVAGLTDEPLQPDQFGPLVSGFAQRTDPAATLALMLRLQPELRRIVVIGGTANGDRQVLERVEEAAQPLFGKVRMEFWTELEYADLLQGVAATPPDTAILFTRFFRDAAGRAYISSQVGRTIARTANAPVYVLSDTSVGWGSVGGSVASLEEFGKRAGILARSILSGTPIESLPFEIRSDTVPMFDSRALTRWGIGESRLPPDSIVRFRPQSKWEQYGWYVAAALIVFALQSALIGKLILQRTRLRRARAAALQSEQLMQLATSAAGLGLWSRDTQTDELWVNDGMRSVLGLTGNPTSFKDVLAHIHPEDRARASGEIWQAQQAELPLETEYRILLPDGSERWLFAKGRKLEQPDGRNTRRLGVVLDITARKRSEQRLRESEENFRRLVESTSAVIWQADPKTWRFTYVGPQAVKLLGYPLEQWYEQDFWIAHIHPEDRERAVHTCTTLSGQTQEFQFDYRMVKADGEVVWIHDMVNCQHVNGNPTQLRGLMFDITERKLAERALRESEDRFRTVANAAPVMIWMSDASNICIFCNSGWVHFAGRTLEHDRVYGWYELLHADDAERCQEQFRQAFELRQEFKMEYRMRRNDAQYRFVLDHGVPRFDSDGTFLGYIATCLDVTERKSAEQSLETQRRFLRQVIDINPNLIFAKDRQGRFTLANQAIAETYGVTADELIGRTDADFNPNAEEVRLSRKIDLEVMDTLCERLIAEERLTDCNGEVRWMQTVKRPITEADGEAHQVLGTSTDITQRKRAEMELQEQRAQITHAARVSVMGELAASLAHELNQPLAAILSNAQAALRFMDRDIADPQEIRSILQDIVAADRRAGDVIRHVRALVKKREADLEFTSIDLAELLRDVHALVHSDAVALNVHIALDVAGDLPAVRSDRVHLQQVVLNLLLNAFDAMRDRPPREREVTVRAARQSDGTLRISISDRGHGLPEQAIDKIFQPFYTTKAEGLGMGLSICRSIIELHGGTLSAENNRDCGATFFFTLPVTQTRQEPSG